MIYPLKNWQELKTGYKFGQKTFYSYYHLGLDVIVPIGTTLYAPSNGSIVKAFNAPQGGNTIWFLDEGNRLWRFLHLSQMSPAKKYNEGDIIGLTGNSGSITSGSGHCHIDISKNGKLELNNYSNFLDPEIIIKELLQPIMNYEKKIIRNQKDGSFALVIRGKKYVFKDGLDARALITFLNVNPQSPLKDEIINVSDKEFSKIPLSVGLNF